MDVYGLTGGIGSGKTAVSSLLEGYGIPVISADELSRMVVAKGSEGLGEVVAEFTDAVLTPSGDLDRKKLASIVFEDADKRERLEAIVHPRIRERYEQVLDASEKAGHAVLVYEIPLLFEKNLDAELKAVILVSAEDDVRIQRVQLRDDISAAEVRARMAAQLDDATKRRRADYVIENNGTLDDLRREVDFMLTRVFRLDPPATVRPRPEARRASAVIGPPTLTVPVPEDGASSAAPDAKANGPRGRAPLAAVPRAPAPPPPPPPPPQAGPPPLSRGRPRRPSVAARPQPRPPGVPYEAVHDDDSGSQDPTAG